MSQISTPKKRINRDDRAISFIYRYLRANGYYPSNQEVADEIGVKVNYWGTIRRRLIKQGGLARTGRGHYDMPPEVIKRLDARAVVLEESRKNINPLGAGRGSLPKPTREDRSPAPEFFKPMEIKVLGEVLAGKDGRPDDLVTLDEASVETTWLPGIAADENVYALQVKGLSMVHEEIKPGDIVILRTVSLPEILRKEI